MVPPVVQPAQAEISGAIVSLEIVPGTDAWVVTVILSRPDASPPLSAGDVTVRASASDGAELAPAERPEGELPEAGGSLGMSVNARYVFAGEQPPRIVSVRYGGQAIEFTVAQGATG